MASAPNGTVETIIEGAEILCADGAVGSVYTVLRDPVTDQPTHIVFRQAVTLTKEVTVPIQYVTQVTRSQVKLSVEKRKVEEMPQFWW